MPVHKVSVVEALGPRKFGFGERLKVSMLIGDLSLDPVLGFLICFIATIPVSFVWRFGPGALAKHISASASGAILSYLSFGLSSNFHFLIPMALRYLLMLLFLKDCGIFINCAGFGYLLGW